MIYTLLLWLQDTLSSRFLFYLFTVSGNYVWTTCKVIAHCLAVSFSCDVTTVLVKGELVQNKLELKLLKWHVLQFHFTPVYKKKNELCMQETILGQWHWFKFFCGSMVISSRYFECERVKYTWSEIVQLDELKVTAYNERDFLRLKSSSRRLFNSFYTAKTHQELLQIWSLNYKSNDMWQKLS